MLFDFCQQLGLFYPKALHKVARGVKRGVTQKPLEDQSVFEEEPPNRVSLREGFTPRTLNNAGIFWTIAGDVFLLNLGFFLAFISDIDLTQASTSFIDGGVWSDTLYISAFVTLAGWLFDKIPTAAVREIVSDTRFYTLRLLGRNTPPVRAFLVSTVLSAAAAFCEELFFRCAVNRKRWSHRKVESVLLQNAA